MFEPIVVDNVLKHPDRLRYFAMSQPYWYGKEHPQGGNYPGKRSDYLSVSNNDAFMEIMMHVHDAIGIPRNASTYTEAFLQYCVGGDGDSWVHRDNLDHFNPTHVGLIYLTPNPPAESGTILYEPKDPNYITGDPMDDSGDPNDYNVKQVLENKYNRMVIYSPSEFHKSDKYFGSSIQDGRLFVVFFTEVK